jgi:hypothetical protein
MGTFSSLIEEADALQEDIAREQANGSPDAGFIADLTARKAAILARAARSAHARLGTSASTVVDHKGRHWAVAIEGTTPTVAEVPAPPSPISGDQVQAIA